MDGAMKIRVPAIHVAEFKELVQRGANLWPDASPEIKEFADVVTIGSAMQDYKKLNHTPTQPRGNQ